MEIQPESTLSRAIFTPWLNYLRFFSNDERAAMLRQAGFETKQMAQAQRSAHNNLAHQLAYAVK